MISENTLYEKHCRRLRKSAVHPLECILNNEYTVNSVAFPKGHTPEEFLDGNKKAIRRNKLITGVLYYSDDMETFATGLKRIKDLCDEAGCKVEFRMERDDFVVVFYRNLREEWNNEKDAEGNSLGSTTKRLPRDYQDKRRGYQRYYA